MTDRIRSLLERVAKAEGSSDVRDMELRQRLPSTSLASLEREIASEIAYSLGRAAEKGGPCLWVASPGGSAPMP